MNPNQIKMARHALGLPSKTGVSYRNQYIVPRGSEAHKDWLEMVENDEAILGIEDISEGCDLFQLIRKGAEQALNFMESLDQEDFPVRVIDLDMPADAREYIETFSERVFKGKEINQVTMEGGEVIHFNDMTDEQAVKVARSLYLDIELPAKGETRQ